MDLQRVLEKSETLRDSNLDFVIFMNVYFEINLIVGQPLLLSEMPLKD